MSLRKAFENKQVLFGSWLQMPGALQAELIARQGFDWVAVDQEHGVFDLEQTSAAFSAIRSAGAYPVARAASADPAGLRRTLDLGAAGIIVPMVESVEMAKGIVDAVRYPPLGSRGFGFCRANQFGASFHDYAENANDDILLIAQIEHIKAVEQIDEILAVEGIDGALIGPYDLSASMGITGQVDDARVLDGGQRVLDACLRAGKVPGFHVVKTEASAVKDYVTKGYQMIAVGMDSIYIRDTCTRLVTDLKSYVPKGEG